MYILHDGRWKRIYKNISKIRRLIKVERLSFSPCDNLSDLVGVPAYAWASSENEICVFDFSASHLCPNQLERIRLAYANVSKRSPHHG